MLQHGLQQSDIDAIKGMAKIQGAYESSFFEFFINEGGHGVGRNTAQTASHPSGQEAASPHGGFH